MTSFQDDTKAERARQQLVSDKAEASRQEQLRLAAEQRQKTQASRERFYQAKMDEQYRNVENNNNDDI